MRVGHAAELKSFALIRDLDHQVPSVLEHLEADLLPGIEAVSVPDGIDQDLADGKGNEILVGLAEAGLPRIAAESAETASSLVGSMVKSLSTPVILKIVATRGATPARRSCPPASLAAPWQATSEPMAEL